MEKLKILKNRQNGITLIALIITIVVLLILAGVTIGSISGNESVLEKAQDAKVRTDLSTEKEAIQLAVINLKTNDDYEKKIEANELISQLQRNNITSNCLIIKDYGNGAYLIQSSIDNTKKYKITTDGKVYLYNVTSTLKGPGGSNSYTGEYYADKSTITKITFENQITGINGATKSWDVSQAQDGSCMAYLIGTELYIQTNGIVSFPEDSSYLFYDFINTQYIYGLENTDTSKVKIMSNILASSNYRTPMKLKQIYGLEYWDTSNVENMDKMFNQCFYLESINLSNFNTNKVTTMQAMFQNTFALKSLDVSSFDTKNVTSMAGMFAAAVDLRISKLETIIGLEKFDTTSVTNMQSMFVHQVSLKELDLSSFDTSSVTNMLAMFGFTNLQKIYVSNNFDIEKVSNSTNMFGRDTSSYAGLSDIPTLVGGNGTTWDANHIDKEYARIDDPDNSKPGYFTYKAAPSN